MYLISAALQTSYRTCKKNKMIYAKYNDVPLKVDSPASELS